MQSFNFGVSFRNEPVIIKQIKYEGSALDPATPTEFTNYCSQAYDKAVLISGIGTKVKMLNSTIRMNGLFLDYDRFQRQAKPVRDYVTRLRKLFIRELKQMSRMSEEEIATQLSIRITNNEKEYVWDKLKTWEQHPTYKALLLSEEIQNKSDLTVAWPPPGQKIRKKMDMNSSKEFKRKVVMMPKIKRSAKISGYLAP